ncbi:hypothetical protein KQI84_11425 [bacterium]|nr:hypothetical protein [bacterium]
MIRFSRTFWVLILLIFVTPGIWFTVQTAESQKSRRESAIQRRVRNDFFDTVRERCNSPTPECLQSVYDSDPRFQERLEFIFCDDRIILAQKGGGVISEIAWLDGDEWRHEY